MKNKNKQMPQVDKEQYDNSKPKKPPVTFEDLLKEFTGEHVKEKEEQEKESQVYEFESDSPSDREIDEVYQKSVQQAEQYEPLNAESLRHDVKFERFNKFEIEEKSGLLDDILDDLSDENGLKKAVIFKEILDKKY